MSGPTPGPWEAIATREVLAPNGRTICRAHLDTSHRTDAESHANARLIAAAPCLLEALEQIAAPTAVPLDQLPDADQPNGWRDLVVERIELARAVVAKVRAAA